MRKGLLVNGGSAKSPGGKSSRSFLEGPWTRGYE